MTQPANRRLVTEDRAALASNLTPAAPSAGAGSAGASGEVSRADHTHPSAGLYAWCGDGSDGDLILDGTNTYDALGVTKTGSNYTLSRTLVARNLTITSGVTLYPAGVPVLVSDTLSGAGTITGRPGKVGYNNRLQVFGPPEVGLVGTSGAGQRPDVDLGGGGKPYLNGGAGGLGAGGAGGAGGFPNSQFDDQGAARLRTLLHTFGFATTGLTLSIDWALGQPAPGLLALYGSSAGGSGGGDGSSGLGGTGGGGGSVVVVNARRVAGSVTITSPGGNGGAGTGANSGGGGGGTGGTVVLNVISATGWTGQLTSPAGTGGAKTGTGVAGSVGTAGITILNVWK